MRPITRLPTLVLLFGVFSAPAAAQSRCRTVRACEDGVINLTDFSRRQLATWIWAQYGDPELTQQHQEMLRSLEYRWSREGLAAARARAGKYYPTPTQIAEAYLYFFAYDFPGDVDELRASIIAWESVEVSQEEIDAGLAVYADDPRRNPTAAVIESGIHSQKFMEEYPGVSGPYALTREMRDDDIRPYAISWDRGGAVTAAMMLNVLAEYGPVGGR